MFYISADFDNYELFESSATKWNLDFKLISRDNFSAHLTLFTNDYFQIGRTSIQGTMEQNGLCPEGFRSIAIPYLNSSRFCWFNRNANTDNLLLFPEDGVIDSVSYNGFDVIVISIREDIIYDTIEDLGLSNLEELFNGVEQYLHQEEQFHKRIIYLSNQFFKFIKSFSKDSLHHQVTLENKIHQIVHNTLIYLNSCRTNSKNYQERKRDHALSLVVDYIQNHLEDAIRIDQLCRNANVSERTLDYAFKEKYHVSPVEYIKAIKLNEVKKELLQSNEQLISSVAAKYGFWHMGQFAADFRKRFGELPSEVQKSRA